MNISLIHFLKPVSVYFCLSLIHWLKDILALYIFCFFAESWRGCCNNPSRRGYIFSFVQFVTTKLKSLLRITEAFTIVKIGHFK